MYVIAIYQRYRRTDGRHTIAIPRYTHVQHTHVFRAVKILIEETKTNASAHLVRSKSKIRKCEKK